MNNIKVENRRLLWLVIDEHVIGILLSLSKNSSLNIMFECVNSPVASLDLKPGLHMVVTVVAHACDDASKRILKLSIYPLQIFLVKHQYL